MPTEHFPSSDGAQSDSTLQMIVRELGDVLDANPNMRLVMRELSQVDRGMREDGLEAFEGFTLEVLQAARHQLALVLGEFMSPGMVTLAAYVEVAIIDRLESAGIDGTAPLRPGFRSVDGLAELRLVLRSRFGDFDAATTLH